MNPKITTLLILTVLSNCSFAQSLRLGSNLPEQQYQSNAQAQQAQQSQIEKPQVKQPIKPTQTNTPPKKETNVIHKNGEVKKVGTFDDCLNRARQMSQQIKRMPEVLEQSENIRKFQWTHMNKRMIMTCDKINNTMSLSE